MKEKVLTLISDLGNEQHDPAIDFRFLIEGENLIEIEILGPGGVLLGSWTARSRVTSDLQVLEVGLIASQCDCLVDTLIKLKRPPFHREVKQDFIVPFGTAFVLIWVTHRSAYLHVMAHPGYEPGPRGFIRCKRETFAQFGEAWLDLLTQHGGWMDEEDALGLLESEMRHNEP